MLFRRPRLRSKRVSSPVAASHCFVLRLRFSSSSTQIEDRDTATGARIVAKALEGPLHQIAVNAGMDGGVVVDKVRNLKGNNGLNAATGEYDRPGQARRHRCCQGDPFGSAERWLYRCAVPDDRSSHQRSSRRRRRMATAACPTWTSRETRSPSTTSTEHTRSKGRFGAPLSRFAQRPHRDWVGQAASR